MPFARHRAIPLSRVLLEGGVSFNISCQTNKRALFFPWLEVWDEAIWPLCEIGNEMELFESRNGLRFQGLRAVGGGVIYPATLLGI